MKKSIKSVLTGKVSKVANETLLNVIKDVKTASAPVLALPLFSPVVSAKIALKAAKENEKREAFLKSEAKRIERETIKAGKVEPVKTAKYTRADAFASAIKNGADFKSNLISLSDSIYVLNGGKSNEKESAWYYNTIVPGLIALNFASYDKDGKLEVFAFTAKKAA